MFISKLENDLLSRISDDLFYSCGGSEIVNQDDIDLARQQINEATDKYEFCNALDSLHYCFSIILSETRQQRRELITAAFQDNPKLSQEKSTLKEKLDAIPEYGKVHKNEEMLFQYLEYIESLKNNVVYMYKDENNE